MHAVFLFWDYTTEMDVPDNQKLITDSMHLV